MSDSTQRTRAFLLRSVDYGESDRVLTLLSEERGKIAAIARGARSSRKRFGGALEPFALLEVSLARGRGSLPRLAEASLLRAYAGLSRSLGRVGAAGFALELSGEVLPEHQLDDEEPTGDSPAVGEPTGTDTLVDVPRSCGEIHQTRPEEGQ